MKTNQSQPVEIDWLIGCLFALLTMIIAVQGITPFHSWGDDFAGYILQAHAIENGSLKKEVLLNQALLQENPVQIGPNAYPWGVPILIWLFAKIVGFEIHRLKIIEVLALGLTGFFIFQLSRFYLSRCLSLIASALVALQPFVIGQADNLLSDLPFLAICTLTIYLIELFHRRTTHEGKPSPHFSVLISAFCLIAFSIRSNGAFLVPTYLASSSWILGKFPQLRRDLLRCVILFVCFFVFFLILYFFLLPDGSLVHANHLSFNPFSLFIRLKEVFYAYRNFIPFYPFDGIGLFVISILILIFSVAGALKNSPYSFGLIVFFILNLFSVVSQR